MDMNRQNMTSGNDLSKRACCWPMWLWSIVSCGFNIKCISQCFPFGEWQRVPLSIIIIIIIIITIITINYRHHPSKMDTRCIFSIRPRSQPCQRTFCLDMFKVESLCHLSCQCFCHSLHKLLPTYWGQVVQYDSLQLTVT